MITASSETNLKAICSTDGFPLVLIAKFTCNENFSADLRAEYYEDRNGVIIISASAQGCRTTGISANGDDKITNNALLSMELRTLTAEMMSLYRSENLLKETLL